MNFYNKVMIFYFVKKSNEVLEIEVESINSKLLYLNISIPRKWTCPTQVDRTWMFRTTSWAAWIKECAALYGLSRI